MIPLWHYTITIYLLAGLNPFKLRNHFNLTIHMHQQLKEMQACKWAPALNCECTRIKKRPYILNKLPNSDIWSRLKLLAFTRWTAAVLLTQLDQQHISQFDSQTRNNNEWTKASPLPLPKASRETGNYCTTALSIIMKETHDLIFQVIIMKETATNEQNTQLARIDRQPT